MVKRQRNSRVWQTPLEKQRKKRSRKQVSPSPEPHESINHSSNITPIENNQPQQQKSNSCNKEEQQQQDNIQIQMLAEESYQSQPMIDEAIQAEPIQEVSQQMKEFRLQILKQVLLSDIEIQQENTTTDEYRSVERQQILEFLTQQGNKESQLMYIYGVPGSGKTFIVKNTLLANNLLDSSKWINCLSILNKSQLKRAPLHISELIRVVVIDQFDQIEHLLSNKKFQEDFKQYMTIILNQCVSNVKFILIANKSHHAVGYEQVLSFQQIMRCCKMYEIPFLPLQQVMRILARRCTQITAKTGRQLLSSSFLELAVKKVYSSTQDIRKVINFVIRSYQGGGTEGKISKETKQQILASSVVEEETVWVKVVKNMPGRQKALFKSLLQFSDQAIKEQKSFLLQTIYRQALKLQLTRQSVDVWLREWEEQGLIKLAPFYEKVRTHQLYPQKCIRTRLTYQQCYHLYY